MDTVETLKRKIQSTTDLHSVVRTMKNLAAASIKQYEKAAQSVELYYQTIETGLNYVVRQTDSQPLLVEGQNRGDLAGVVLFASDQGMCGQFNSEIAAFFSKKMGEIGFPREKRRICVVGCRVLPYLEDLGEAAEKVFSVPGSLPGVTSLIHALSVQIEKWREHLGLNRLLLFFNRREQGSAFAPEYLQILPIDRNFIRNYEQLPRQGPSLPYSTLPKGELFRGLIRQYLFVAFYRSCTLS